MLATLYNKVQILVSLEISHSTLSEVKKTIKNNTDPEVNTKPKTWGNFLGIVIFSSNKTDDQGWAWETEEWFKIKIGQLHPVLRSHQQSCKVQKHWPLQLPLQQPYEACSRNSLQYANTYATSVFVYI